MTHHRTLGPHLPTLVFSYTKTPYNIHTQTRKTGRTDKCVRRRRVREIETRARRSTRCDDDEDARGEARRGDARSVFLFFLCARVARAVVAVDARWRRRVASVITRASYPRDEMMGRDDVRAVTRDARGGDSETSSRRIDSRGLGLEFFRFVASREEGMDRGTDGARNPS
jgi:hypothetical protein